MIAAALRSPAIAARRIASLAPAAGPARAAAAALLPSRFSHGSAHPSPPPPPAPAPGQNSGPGKTPFMIGRFMMLAALIMLGPAYGFVAPAKPDDKQPEQPLPLSKPQAKTKIPLRSPTRSDQPKPIRGVPFVPYVLVGGGTASYSAMEAIREVSPNAQILIVSEEEFPPYQRPPLSKELWFNEERTEDLRFKDWQGNDSSLFYRPKEFFNILNADDLDKLDPSTDKVHFLAGASAVKINPEDQTILLANGKRVQYGRMLIATGGTPKTIFAPENIPENIRSKVLTFRGIHDFKRLEAAAQKGKTIAVIGGGFLGSELSVAIAARQGDVPGLKVIQVFPEDGNMGLIFPRYLTKWTTQTLRNVGIDVKSNTQIDSIGENGGKVELCAKDGSKIVVDYAVVAVGLSPNEELAKSSGLEIDSVRGGILVNAELEARTHIFAAGDVSSYHDIALGRRRVEHYDHAVMSGRIAGFNMTGAKRPYTHQSMFWSDLGPNISYQAVGIIDSNLPTVSVWAKRSEDGESMTTTAHEEYGKGVVFYLTPEREIIGVLMWNLFGKMDLARKVIRDKRAHTDIESLAKLFSLHA